MKIEKKIIVSIEENVKYFKSLGSEELICHVFPRPNGTYMLKWNTTEILAAVCIGESVFTYAIIGKDGKTRIHGTSNITTDNIREFYNNLTKA